MCEKIEKKHRLSVGTVGKSEKKRSGEESGAGRNQPSSLMIIRFEQFQNNFLIKILDPKPPRNGLTRHSPTGSLNAQ